MAVHDESQSLKEQILQLWRTLVLFYLKNPRIVSFIRQYKNSPYFTPEMDAETDEYFVFLFELGDRAIQENIVKDLPRQILMTLCLDFVGNLAQMHAKGILELTDDLMEKIILVTWDAVKR